MNTTATAGTNHVVLYGTVAQLHPDRLVRLLAPYARWRSLAELGVAGGPRSPEATRRLVQALNDERAPDALKLAMEQVADPNLAAGILDLQAILRNVGQKVEDNALPADVALQLLLFDPVRFNDELIARSAMGAMSYRQFIHYAAAEPSEIVHGDLEAKRAAFETALQAFLDEQGGHLASPVVLCATGKELRLLVPRGETAFTATGGRTLLPREDVLVYETDIGRLAISSSRVYGDTCVYRDLFGLAFGGSPKAMVANYHLYGDSLLEFGPGVLDCGGIDGLDKVELIDFHMRQGPTTQGASSGDVFANGGVDLKRWLHSSSEVSDFSFLLHVHGDRQPVHVRVEPPHIIWFSRRPGLPLVRSFLLKIGVMSRVPVSRLRTS